jgi:hypothetical protein
VAVATLKAVRGRAEAKDRLKSWLFIQADMDNIQTEEMNGIRSSRLLSDLMTLSTTVEYSNQGE